MALQKEGLLLLLCWKLFCLDEHSHLDKASNLCHKGTFEAGFSTVGRVTRTSEIGEMVERVTRMFETGEVELRLNCN